MRNEESMSRRLGIWYAAIRASVLAICAALSCCPLLPSPGIAQDTPQRPRLTKAAPEGRREKLALGSLFLTAKRKWQPGDTAPLLIHFHGGDWLPEVVADKRGDTAVIAVQLGSGSAVYAKPFEDPKRFLDLLAEAEKKAGCRFEPITLSSWSAGYGAVRQILRSAPAYDRVQGVILLDGMHAGYLKEKNRPARVNPEHVDPFVRFAQDAVAGKRHMLITHAEIVPGTYASNRETSDYLLAELRLARFATRQSWPAGMQLLSETRQGRFQLLGYAGNSAADHVDHLHALAEFIDRLRQ
jgi:hypothetical protein